MCKTVLSLAGALLLSLAGHAQDFQTVFTTSQADFLLDGVQLENNDFILAGHTSGFGEGSSDGLLVRTDEFGEMLWSKAYGSLGGDNFRVIRSTSDGNLIVGGSTQSVDLAGLPNPFYALISPDGEVIWSRYLDGELDDQLRDIQPLADGGFIATGLTNSYSEDMGYDIFLTRLNAQGEVIWSRVYGSDNYDVPLSILAHSDGDFYVWGHQEGDATANYDTMLIKFDADGNLVWQQRFGLEQNELAWDILEATNGEVLVSGDSNSSGLFGLNDSFIIRLSTDGDMVWSRHFGGPLHDHGTQLVHIENDSYGLAGATSNFGNGGLDFLLVHINDNGGIKYAEAYGGELKDVVHGLISTNDDGLLAVGETRSFGEGFYSGMAVKIDQDAENVCSAIVGTEYNSAEIEFTVGSPDVELRAEGLESATSDFLTVTDANGDLTEETICTEAPPGVGFEHSEVTEAVDNRHDRLRLVPNPSPGNVTAIIRTQHEVVSELTVFNLGGQIVYQESIMGTNGHRNLQLTGLPKGIYLARLASGERVETRKLIVE